MSSPSPPPPPPPLPAENIRPTRERHLKGPLAAARILVDLFSSNDGRNDPPSDDDEGGPPRRQQRRHARIITIAPSHYCEKARWALDLAESDGSLYYTEDAHPPAFQSFATVPASGDTASITPMVLLDPPPPSDGSSKATKPELIVGSDAILRRFLPELYPEEIEQEVKAIESDLGRRLGPTARAVAYHHLIHPKYYHTLTKICTGQTSEIETFLFDKMVDKGIGKGIRRAMGIDAASCEASVKELDALFSELSKRLERNGGRYLLDEPGEPSRGFTAADLTFAALASPLVRPPALRNFRVDDDELPPELRKLGDGWRDTVAGRHALRMYEKHRFASPGRANAEGDPLVRRVVVKSVGRDLWNWKRLGLYGAGAGCLASAIAVAIVAAKDKIFLPPFLR